MKKPVRIFLTLIVCGAFYSSHAQKRVTIAGEAVLRLAVRGEYHANFNSELPWSFASAIPVQPRLNCKVPRVSENFPLTNTGNVGIGTLAPSEKLHVNSNIRAGGTRISFGKSEHF